MHSTNIQIKNTKQIFVHTFLKCFINTVLCTHIRASYIVRDFEKPFSLLVDG